MATTPVPTSEAELLDDLIGDELLKELHRLTAETRERLCIGELLPALGSLQVIANRCEDLAGWIQRLIARRVESDAATDPALAPAGPYL